MIADRRREAMTATTVRRRPGAALAAVLSAALLAACDKPAPSGPTASAGPAANAAAASSAGHGASGIAWREAANDAEIDAAFAAARAEHKPVFVYWGAKWCPPCNQVKATLFNRQDFIERSRAFVAVYVDGDSPGAQKIGARFHVRGYPTMVLFNAGGTEVTRLPGEVEPVRYTEVLTLGMNAARPVRDVLADALAHPSTLGPDDWRLLAFYSWDTDEQQIVPRQGVPATMRALADACPADADGTAMRLRLKALAAVEDVKKAPKVDPSIHAAVIAMLGDEARARAQTDMVTNYATEIVRAMSSKGTAERAALLAAFDGALKRLEADTTLSSADRMQALIAQVDLARIDEPAHEAKPGVAKEAPRLPAALVADVRAQVGRADREITDGYERQAVITAAAYLLQRAGLGAESDALLKDNLAKSHSPYYLMSGLASNAKQRGDKAEALHWSREAFEKSEGPATRLQWGASYIETLVELAPHDEAAIEAATTQLWSEAAAQPDAFYERSARSLQKVGARLQAWNKGGAHRASMARLEAKLGSLCAAPSHSEAERATCRSLLGAPAKPTAA
jgi:thiol-disulfide isomerase/thioredoxin